MEGAFQQDMILLWKSRLGAIIKLEQNIFLSLILFCAEILRVSGKIRFINDKGKKNKSRLHKISLIFIDA